MSSAAPHAPRSRALIAVSKPAPRRGLLATCARVAVATLLLPVRLPVLAILFAARGVASIGSGAGRAVAAVGRGLGRGAAVLGTGVGRLVAAPFVLVAKLVVLLARTLVFVLRVPLVALRLLGRGGVGAARGIAWLGAIAGRGIAALLLLPVRIVVLLARLVALLARLVARALVLVLRVPLVVLRLLGRGSVGAARGIAFLGTAIAVPAAALSWGAAKYAGAGIAATVRSIVIVLAFMGRLLLRGLAVLGRETFATIASLAIGTFVCFRATVGLVLRIAFLPFIALRILVVLLARGVRNGAVLLVEAGRMVVAGLAEIARAAVALARLAGIGIRRLAPVVGAALATHQPQYAALLPLGTLGVLGAAEVFGAGGFPFATVGLLIIGSFASLALLSRPVNVLAVLLAWALAVATGWRAERVSFETSVWLDALVYLSAIAAIRSAYVAARAFVREVPSIPRDAVQERAHRRASRAIGIVLAAQCVAFALWSAADGDLSDAPLFGELLLVGAGMALAWVVRSGQYVRTAQAVLSLGAIAALVGVIAAQLGAFAAGRLFTAASLGAGVMLLLVAAALTVVVHTRLIDTEHGA